MRMTEKDFLLGPVGYDLAKHAADQATLKIQDVASLCDDNIEKIAISMMATYMVVLSLYVALKQHAPNTAASFKEAILMGFERIGTK